MRLLAERLPPLCFQKIILSHKKQQQPNRHTRSVEWKKKKTRPKLKTQDILLVHSLMNDEGTDEERRAKRPTNDRTNEAAESTGERVGVVRRSNVEEGCTKRWIRGGGSDLGGGQATRGGSEAR